MISSFYVSQKWEKSVSTASTRSRNRKKKRGPSAAAPKGKTTEPTISEPAASREMSERAWRIAGVCILLVAAGLRFYNLNLVPLHHDEGVNGNFLVRLVREGFYTYDPENYHGPTLYYFSAVIPWITKLLFGSATRDNYGLTTFNIRLVTVLFGLGTIVLVFMLRRRLGLS